MRIFGIEISRVPKPELTVWHRQAASPLGVRITDMTPDEMRRELFWVQSVLCQGGAIFLAMEDPFRRILMDLPTDNMQ